MQRVRPFFEVFVFEWNEVVESMSSPQGKRLATPNGIRVTFQKNVSGRVNGKRRYFWRFNPMELLKPKARFAFEIVLYPRSGQFVRRRVFGVETPSVSGHVYLFWQRYCVADIATARRILT
tara:strand:- start:66 stop:428 length:363 start_codon:yes stop_codon:yes gene_type:complete